jgi:hypothetical protein
MKHKLFCLDTIPAILAGLLAGIVIALVAVGNVWAEPGTPPTATPLPETTPVDNSKAERTPPPISPTPPPGTVRFAVIGDYGLAGPMEEEVANLVKSWNPDFIVTTGDNNYPYGAPETIDENIGQYYHEYIHPYQGSYGEGSKTNRFFPILGNHDQDYTIEPYLNYFTLPGNERYYTFTHKMIDFFMLNSLREPDGMIVGSTQANWLQQELAASDACWKLVFAHHPPFTSDIRGMYGWMDWPYEEWGADALLSGHHHSYERFVFEGSDFPYFVNGLGGGPRYVITPEVPEGSQVRYNEDHGAMLVEATSSTITFQFITRQNEVIDTYTLEKSCGWYTLWKHHMP